MKKRLIACVSTLTALVAMAGVANATLPASVGQCAHQFPISTNLDCAINGNGQLYVYATANSVSVTVTLVTGVRANSQGYNSSGSPISGAFVTTTVGNTPKTSSIVSGVVFHDATGTPLPP